VKFWEIDEVSDLDLDLGPGQGHIGMRNAYRTTSLPDRVSVSFSSTEIWPFEFRVISTLREV